MGGGEDAPLLPPQAPRGSIAGEVAQRNVEPGEGASPGLSLIRIVNLNPVRVSCAASELQVRKMNLGQEAKVTVDALAGRAFTGRITDIAPETRKDQRVFSVRLEIPNSDRALLAGMFARIEIKEELKKNGAYELSEDQVKRITELVIAEPGGPGREGAANKNFVGKNADFIAKHIGLTVPPDTRMLLCEVGREHPLLWTEQLMPVMPLVRVKDVDIAIDLAVEVEHGFRHTAIMHSLNIAKLSKMAKAMNCSIFIKNGPSYAGLGEGGAGFASFTIASPTGEGVTRARTFTRERRCTIVDYFRII